jgi:putative NIF3 family GTP cyclohydrolase 1 type 2
MKTRISVLIISIILLNTLQVGGQNNGSASSATAKEIIEKIINNTGASRIPNTVDVIKEGDPQTVITGIVTTMFATMDVLKKAVEKNCNLIIVHEPLYYNHTDATTQFENDPVFIEKRDFIRKNKLVIWRFHDYIHRMKPDGIEAGMVAKLGWKDFVMKGSTNMFVLPETDLKNLLKSLKQVFPKNAFYVVGNPDMKFTHVALAAGAPGSQSHIRILRSDETEVVLAGESPQWETYEYMRDAVSQGRKKAIVFLGHVSSEEAGMDYCAEWLRGFIKDIPVSFVESGPAYWSY